MMYMLVGVALLYTTAALPNAKKGKWGKLQRRYFHHKGLKIALFHQSTVLKFHLHLSRWRHRIIKWRNLVRSLRLRNHGTRISHVLQQPVLSVYHIHLPIHFLSSFSSSSLFPPPPTSFTASNAIFRSKWKFVCGITMLLHILLVQRHYPHYLTIYLVSFRILPFLISLSSWKKKPNYFLIIIHPYLPGAGVLLLHHET